MYVIVLMQGFNGLITANSNTLLLAEIELTKAISISLTYFGFLDYWRFFIVYLA